MSAHPRYDNQAKWIDSRNKVKKGNMNGFNKRRNTKWRNNEAKEI